MKYIYVYIEDEPECKFDYATHDYIVPCSYGNREFLKVYENREDGSRPTKLLVPVEKLICLRCE